jgi:proteasome lid subunit RPN8/RPN11
LDLEAPPDWELARAWAEAHAPHEAVCAYHQVAEGWRFTGLTNVSPAPATSFVVEPLAWCALERQALGRPVWLVHSHVDGPAELSRRDLEAMTVDHRPLLPALGLAVISVRSGQALELKAFVWDGRWQTRLRQPWSFLVAGGSPSQPSSAKP